ncbi:hypothetical protein [Pseudonocardia sp. HH130630-07]|uniref:hypothetical protein n=1 Tax=Pseudonocardia sp. HH130630-07 TaxID=1690815 RepID=UPI00081519F4|nr:hypothetical protein [Pseudonocardia sp. HH130630-07]ANY09035.1 hypothetical protein AFB00_25360 [Pseudonocardia sp. HH130630-07]
MTDARQARDALAEVRDRQQQVGVLVWRQGMPAWLMGTVAVLYTASSVAQDVRTQFPQWNGVLLKWAVPGLTLLAIVAVLVLVRRRLGLAPNGAAGRAYSVLGGLALTFLLLTITIGMVLRSNDVPWDQTLSTGAAMTVVLVIGLAVRRADLRRAERQR